MESRYKQPARVSSSPTAHRPAMPSMPRDTARDVRDKAESIRRGYLASPEVGDVLIARYVERLLVRGQAKAAEFVMRQFGSVSCG